MKYKVGDIIKISNCICHTAWHEELHLIISTGIYNYQIRPLNTKAVYYKETSIERWVDNCSDKI